MKLNWGQKVCSKETEKIFETDFFPNLKKDFKLTKTV